MPVKLPSRVVYTQRLKDYMEKKGYRAISMELLSPMGAMADSTELHTKFVGEKEAAKLKAKGFRAVPVEAGELLLGRGVEWDDEVEVGLRSFLGLKDITVKGIYAFRL